MIDEFTPEELKEVIRAARIFNPGFGEEQFESLIELETRLTESGYLETVSGLWKLEKETGVPLSQVLETRERLLRENEELRQKVIARNTELEALEGRLKAVEQKYREVVRAVQDATTRLEELRRARAREEREHAAFQRKAAMERQRIDEELAECRRKVNVNKEEVVAAGQIKAEVEKHGFTLELALSVAGEFAGYGDASERLAAGLKKEGSLTRYSKELEDWGNGRRVALLSEMSRLEAQNRQLEEERLKLQTGLAQLRVDEAVEQELRQFYHRFGGLGGVLELLSKWKRVYPLRCNNPAYIVTRAFNPSAGCARIWTDKLFSNRCPHCGLNTLDFDAEAYEAFGVPVGRPVKISLGVES